MGGLFKRLAAKFPMRVRYGSEIKEIDITAKKITCGNGVTDAFDFLVSSMPLNTLVGQALSEAPETIRRHAAELRWNSCRITGLGFETPVENHVSWAYFPESFFPFYRVTALASYSPDIVPGADISAFSSFMCETTARDGKAADKRLFHDAVSASGMSRRKLPHPLSFHTIFLPYAYPVPTLERDRHLAAIQEFLESRDIYSRGRFGGWKYEAGNMDHSMMQGMEAIDRILLGRREEVYRTG
jgi:protoporphyrinogen oxidase